LSPAHRVKELQRRRVEQGPRAWRGIERRREKQGAPRMAWGCDPGGGEASDTRCIHVWKAVRSWRPRRRMPEFKRYAVAERERRKRKPRGTGQRNGNAEGGGRAPRLAWDRTPEGEAGAPTHGVGMRPRRRRGQRHSMHPCLESGSELATPKADAGVQTIRCSGARETET